MKVIVSFSGGKDSLASLIWVKNNITENFQTVFCDTGWEHDLTYSHIKEVEEKLNLDLVVIKSKKYSGFVDLAMKKKRFPSSQARFCTEELKTKPMIDYILDCVNDDVLIIQGIRAGESLSRSKMQAQCTYFKYYKQSYGNDKKGKPKFHTYRKSDVLEFITGRVDDLLRPLFDWDSDQVVNYILENGLKPNPLYYQGFKRVGCFPCIMCGHKEIQQIIKLYPERIDFIRDIENIIGSTFFNPDYIPKRFMANKSYPVIDDVVKYLTNKNATADLFAENEGTSCMSFYGLCE
jgi:3'-phosphoadenosine 5'-phosphosulfate sulfotransferase (PAPS reductase)/FAD synthetase